MNLKSARSGPNPVQAESKRAERRLKVAPRNRHGAQKKKRALGTAGESRKLAGDISRAKWNPEGL